MSSTVLATVVFWPAAGASLAASAVLVSRLERLSARLHMPEAILGITVALAADAPEITSAVSAMASGQHDIGAGVVLGSNAFNIAALLGLAAIVAGQIQLHRKVILFEGALALWIAALSIATVTGVLPAAVALALALAALLPYLVVSAVHPADRHRLPLPRPWRTWLASAVSEEELEVATALRARAGRPADAVAGAFALVVVVVASIAMERSATTIGTALHMPAVVTGGLVLAAVTSLPNAVSAVYLSSRGRGSATLSGAMNSNTLNVIAGLLVPAVLTGVSRLSAASAVIAVWYAGLTLGALWLALRKGGLYRLGGMAIVLAYLVMVPVVLLGL